MPFANWRVLAIFVVHVQVTEMHENLDGSRQSTAIHHQRGAGDE